MTPKSRNLGKSQRRFSWCRMEISSIFYSKKPFEIVDKEVYEELVYCEEVFEVFDRLHKFSSNTSCVF